MPISRTSSFNANSWENYFFGVPKALFHKNDFGGSVAGPILKDKLFFFFGLEKDNIPGQSQLSGLFLTPAMQQGNYTYVGTDGNVHAVNLFSVAGGTPDTTVAGEISKINNSLSSGTVTSVPAVPYNVEQVIFNEPNNLYWTYPTVRVDYNATRKLRLNFALNESKFSAPTTLAQTLPGPPFAYQTTGASNNGYTASVGADWTVSPTLINQFRGGYLYNSSVSAANQVGDPQKYKFIDFWNGQSLLLQRGLSELGRLFQLQRPAGGIPPAAVAWHGVSWKLHVQQDSWSHPAVHAARFALRLWSGQHGSAPRSEHPR